jgi:hypothetical protein
MDVNYYASIRARDKSHQIISRKSAERYLKNPAVCLNCNKKIPLRIEEAPAETKKKKFCSHKCAAIFNNKKRGFKSGRRVCPMCKKLKSYESKYCQSCTLIINWDKIKNKPIKNFFIKGTSRAKYNAIRKWARKLMDRSKIEKKCRLCSYSETVQVAHLKKISTYSEDTPIGIVNDLSNLIYLCPNEHILYDKGKLSI